MINCDIGKYTKKVKGLESDSASPSDTWIVDFKGISYNGEPVKDGKVFMKIFVKPDHNTNQETKALVYEAKFYKYIVGFMNRGGLGGKVLNPNYVTYYANILCPFNTFYKMLVNSGMNTHTAINNLYRNFSIMTRMGPSRPAINRNTAQFTTDQEKNYLKNKMYHAILTKPSSGEKVSDFFEKIDKRIKNNIHKMECCIVSTVTGLLSMYYLKAAHNDLHIGNVFTRKLDKNEGYKIDGANGIFSFALKKNGIGVSIYDFDRGYVPYLNKNPLLEDGNHPWCYEKMQCNVYVFSRDIIKFVCYLQYFNTNNLLHRILKCIVKNDLAYNDLLKRIRSNRRCSVVANIRGVLRTVDTTWVRQNAYPPNVILEKLVTTFIRDGNPYLNIINTSDTEYNLTRRYTEEQAKKFTIRGEDPLKFKSLSSSPVTKKPITPKISMFKSNTKQRVTLNNPIKRKRSPTPPFKHRQQRIDNYLKQRPKMGKLLNIKRKSPPSSPVTKKPITPKKSTTKKVVPVKYKFNTSPKKSTAKKSTVKKSTAKMSTAKKSTTKRLSPTKIFKITQLEDEYNKEMKALQKIYDSGNKRYDNLEKELNEKELELQKLQKDCDDRKKQKKVDIDKKKREIEDLRSQFYKMESVQKKKIKSLKDKRDLLK